MAGIKNPIQQRNWFLPPDNKSTTIEERHLFLKEKTLTTPTYCHFCGKVLGEQRDGSASAMKRAQDEIQTGTHLSCLQKNMSY